MDVNNGQYNIYFNEYHVFYYHEINIFRSTIGRAVTFGLVSSSCFESSRIDYFLCLFDLCTRINNIILYLFILLKILYVVTYILKSLPKLTLSSRMLMQ